tara:strand:- start:8674 stop:8907 length:234 start_codon:yes stop_codon:yes gene_type:complete
MICNRCGFDNSIVEESTDPCFMYQVQGNEVKGEKFHPRKIPDGWYDSPKAAKAALEVKVEVKQEVKEVKKGKSKRRH